MLNRSIFSKRFKLIRACYKFTFVEFSNIFKIVSKTTVNSWEKETNIPSADVLADLSTFFGISMDWFAGFSSIPYTQESIENAESNVLKNIAEVDHANLFFKICPKEYLNHIERNTLYSLSIRANIIVLLHCWYIPFCETYYLKQADDKSSNSSLVSEESGDDFYKPMLVFMPLLSTGKKFDEHYQNFFALLYRKITTPIYDIESGEIK